MAGGKETPRQKMIGMMYIVLTALLALNVSKQILDAFVAIELNIQNATKNQLGRSEAQVSLLKETMADKSASINKRNKTKKFLEIINKIDKEAAIAIEAIDKIKLNILEESEGKDAMKVNKDLKTRDKSIVWLSYDKSNPLVPTKLNLAAVQVKDQFDIPMNNIIGSGHEPEKSQSGLAELWPAFKKYRSRIVELAGTYTDEKKYNLRMKEINDFKDDADLTAKILKEFSKKGNNVNKDDVNALATIYSELTKDELADYKFEENGAPMPNVHWLVRTFYHSPMVGAIASLSSMQYEIISARAKAINLLSSKISAGEYSFNRIEGMAMASVGVAEVGEKFTVKIWMGAFDSDKQPTVSKLNGKENPTINTKLSGDGFIVVDMVGTGSDKMEIKGTVSIPDKNLNSVPKDFKTEIFIAQKNGGSVGLPDVAVLYENWNNKITASAGGTNNRIKSVSVNGKACPKQGAYYIARIVANAPTGFITVSAVDKDNKPVTFKQQVKLRPFPKPQCLTEIMPLTGGTVYAGLKGSVLEGVTFTVTSMLVGSTKLSGGRVPANALRAYSSGSVVGVEGECVRNDTNTKHKFSGSIKLQ